MYLFHSDTHNSNLYSIYKEQHCNVGMSILSPKNLTNWRDSNPRSSSIPLAY
jgi:hypothetical protein